MNTPTTISLSTGTRILDKLPSTNRKEYRAAIRSYLAACTEVEDKEDATEDERIAHLLDRFRAEYGWRIAQAGAQTAALDWLQGLAINVEYMNHAIPATVLRIHGIEGATMSERLADTVVGGWWQHLAANVVRLLDKERKA